MIKIDSKGIHIPSKLIKIIVITVLIILLYFLRNWQIENMITNEEKQTSRVILDIVNDQAKSGLLLPKIVILSKDILIKNKLNDSISQQISAFLITKYLKKESVDPDKIDYTPFFIYPDSTVSRGNYAITKEQLEELKNHIAFLTIQVDKAVQESKTEISRETGRINTLVVIWIGVVGMLGILFLL
ncbi:MAG: hypothetical protein JWQ63_1853 [Mucilaginibacter sp.]|nr:hypothetical protein [Mucilaginibacter sp.]